MALVVKFPYTIISGELTAEKILLLPLGCKVVVLGKKTRRVFAKGFTGTCQVTAFYIRYNGVEYGSCKLTQKEFEDLAEGEDDMIFDYEFEDLFE